MALLSTPLACRLLSLSPSRAILGSGDFPPSLPRYPITLSSKCTVRRVHRGQLSLKRCLSMSPQTPFQDLQSFSIEVAPAQTSKRRGSRGAERRPLDLRLRTRAHELQGHRPIFRRLRHECRAGVGNSPNGLLVDQVEGCMGFACSRMMNITHASG